MRSLGVGWSGVAFLAAGLLGGIPVTAWATPSPPTPITIVNPSFEANTPSNTAGVYYNGGVGSQDYYAFGSFTGWSWNGASYAGWWHPSTLEYPGGGSTSVAATNIPNGAQVAFVNGGASLSQVLTTKLTSNSSYALSFSVGQRSDIPLPSAYSVELLAGSNILATWSNLMAPLPTAPGAGEFVSDTLLFTSQTQNDPYAGLALGVVLQAGGSTNNEVSYDALNLNVINDVNLIPEPTSVGVLIVGLIGTLVLSRRRAPAKNIPASSTPSR